MADKGRGGQSPGRAPAGPAALQARVHPQLEFSHVL